MKEQSHKDEMSAALRGDFQRLRQRGVAVTLAPSEPRTAEPEPAGVADAVSDTAPAEPASRAAPAAQVSDTDTAPSDTSEADAGEEPRGWLGRLLGR